MNTQRHSVKNWEIFSLAFVVFLKLINFFFIVFLLNLKVGLYPYADIGDSFYPNIVDLDALGFRILCSVVGLILGALSSWVCFCAFRGSHSTKFFKRIFMILLITSVLEMLFCGFRFVELRHILSLTENCEFLVETPGCYLSPY